MAGFHVAGFERSARLPASILRGPNAASGRNVRASASRQAALLGLWRQRNTDGEGGRLVDSPPEARLARIAIPGRGPNVAIDQRAT